MYCLVHALRVLCRCLADEHTGSNHGLMFLQDASNVFSAVAEVSKHHDPGLRSMWPFASVDKMLQDALLYVLEFGVSGKILIVDPPVKSCHEFLECIAVEDLLLVL